MAPAVLAFMRYGIPAVLAVVGLVVLFVVDDPGEAAMGWAGFTGAGLAVLLINVLVRIGNEGERDREREETARRYFDEHGRWPN